MTSIEWWQYVNPKVVVVMGTIGNTNRNYLEMDRISTDLRNYVASADTVIVPWENNVELCTKSSGLIINSLAQSDIIKRALVKSLYDHFFTTSYNFATLNDFNEYTTPGIYKIETYSKMLSMANNPGVNYGGGLLVVFDNLITGEQDANRDYITQWFIGAHQRGGICSRTKNYTAFPETGWSEWKVYAGKDDIIGNHKVRINLPVNSALDGSGEVNYYRLGRTVTVTFSITALKSVQGSTDKDMVVSGLPIPDGSYIFGLSGASQGVQLVLRTDGKVYRHYSNMQINTPVYGTLTYFTES